MGDLPPFSSIPFISVKMIGQEITSLLSVVASRVYHWFQPFKLYFFLAQSSESLFQDALPLCCAEGMELFGWEAAAQASAPLCHKQIFESTANSLSTAKQDLSSQFPLRDRNWP